MVTLVLWVILIHVQEITNMEENVDFPAGVPVWSTGSASVQADYNGDKVNIIDDKDVHELEQKELQDLTDSGVSSFALILS